MIAMTATYVVPDPFQWSWQKDIVPKKLKMNENFQMIGQGGWDVYVTGANGFVGKELGWQKQETVESRKMLY